MNKYIEIGEGRLCFALPVPYIRICYPLETMISRALSEEGMRIRLFLESGRYS